MISQYKDRLTPRERLSHKLRDGKYRARQQGCPAETIPVGMAMFLLSQKDCYYCGCRLGDLWTLEHKISLYNGGAHTLDNLVRACPECNQDKHIQDELDYLARLDSAS
jgi:5-methylcytosine-specific restriction endonuclease McrA